MEITVVFIHFKGFIGKVDRFFESKETADHYVKIMEENELVENVYRFVTQPVWASAIKASEEDLELVDTFNNHFKGKPEREG